LELEVPIGGEKHLETRIGSASQQFSVAEASSALVLNRMKLMAEEFLREMSR
jgi:hypothetical protein